MCFFCVCLFFNTFQSTHVMTGLTESQEFRTLKWIRKDRRSLPRLLYLTVTPGEAENHGDYRLGRTLLEAHDFMPWPSVSHMHLGTPVSVGAEKDILDPCSPDTSLVTVLQVMLQEFKRCFLFN